jgi:hypothetical protein
VCREEETYGTKRQAAQKIIDEAKASGLVQLHSCIANLLDPMPKTCKCRKFVNFADAREFLRIGRAVDFITRKACFHKRGIVEVSRFKKVPRSGSLEKPHLEKAYASQQSKRLQGKTIEELQAIVEADQRERTLEAGLRIEIFGAMNADLLRSMVVEIPAAKWDELERLHKDVPVLLLSSTDQRTSGGVGRNVRSAIESIDDTEEFERRPADDVVDAIEIDGIGEAGTESEAIIESESGDPTEDADQIERDEEFEEAEIETESEEMAEAA